MKKIRIFSLFTFTFYLALSASAITATKAYVDGATNATLTAAKVYTDQAVVAAGAVTPSIATNIANLVVTNNVASGYLCTVAAANNNYAARHGFQYGTGVSTTVYGTEYSEKSQGSLSSVFSDASYCIANAEGAAAVKREVGFGNYDYSDRSANGGRTYLFQYIDGVKTIVQTNAWVSDVISACNGFLRTGGFSAGSYMTGNIAFFNGDDYVGEVGKGQSGDILSFASYGQKIQFVADDGSMESMLTPDNSDVATSNMVVGIVSERGMPNNGLVLDGNAVKTKGGTAVTAANVGATTSAYVDQQNAATRAIVQTWESFLDGSNVVFSITNYISGAYNLNTAKFRILEMTNGVYREVYNSRGEIVMHLDDFKTNDFRVATNLVITSVDAKIAGKADKAWGKYTSSGGEAPSNTVYMTAPSTVFAGGMEYERVAVGEGSVCILTTKGAPIYTTGDEGTFKFQDDGGTNYFGFAKTDSYTIGCHTDGISVSSGIVTLEYDVTMSGVPCVWHCASLDARPIVWEQLNLPDGSPVPGASKSVTWEASPPAGKEICYLNCSEPSGFFKATIEVAGSAKFMTNMPADLGGGIICTNTSIGANGIIRPTYNGSQVIWTWSAN